MAEAKPKKGLFADIGSGKVKLKKAKNVKDKSSPQLTGYLTNDT